MNGTISISKSALVKIIDGLGLPNPDDPGNPGNPWGPFGPAGPVVALSRWIYVLLNPQPLPPVAGPQPEPWFRMGPGPQPWRAAWIARLAIERAVAQAQLAEVLAGTEGSERLAERLRSLIGEFIDDYCGTGPRRWPLPWPGPFGSDAPRPGPVELLVAGAQFQKAAEAMEDNPLREVFSAAADQLFETGLKRMEGQY